MGGEVGSELKRRIVARLVGYGVDDPETIAHLIFTIPDIQSLLRLSAGVDNLFASLKQELTDQQDDQHNLYAHYRRSE
jgi:hypothetical protein